jgi:hypothetical protein
MLGAAMSGCVLLAQGLWWHERKEVTNAPSTTWTQTASSWAAKTVRISPSAPGKATFVELLPEQFRIGIFPLYLFFSSTPANAAKGRSFLNLK